MLGSHPPSFSPFPSPPPNLQHPTYQQSKSTQGAQFNPPVFEAPIGLSVLLPGPMSGARRDRIEPVAIGDRNSEW